MAQAVICDVCKEFLTMDMLPKRVEFFKPFVNSKDYELKRKAYKISINIDPDLDLCDTCFKSLLIKQFLPALIEKD